jgi:peptidoglycan/xylan/chitin deacetylase (PgdA/CDA1 family)
MIVPIIIGILVVIVMAWLTVSYSFLVPPKQGLPILMYHKVSENLADGLTIPFDKLDKQFSYIREKGYQTIFFEELASLLNSGQKLPGKTLIITFDDAYKSFSTFALPLMEKYNIKATVFIPVAYMGKENAWDKGNDRIMSPEELKDLKKRKLVDYGIHSFLHSNYKNMVLQDMKEDLSNCINTLNFHDIPFSPVFAYPYGGYPKKDKILLRQMKDLFRDFKFDFALRIGNRINHVPFNDPYELKRIDIKGTDSMYTFTIKLRKGRQKLFS